MSLARAFTTRKLRMSMDHSDAKGPQRAQTLRHKISAPVQLVHTTNMLAYNAPDLPRSGRSNSLRSATDDSDSVATSDSTPPTSPDIDVDERIKTPEPNHLSGFFFNSNTITKKSESEAAPAIPKRSPSHTKKNSFDIMGRSSSTTRMSRDSEISMSTKQSRTFSRSPSTSTRASSVSTTRSLKQSPPPPTPAPLSLPTTAEAPEPSTKELHPFGPELAQVTELAEEYSSSSQLGLEDEDSEYIHSRGLVKLRADDYLGLIQGLSSLFFSDSSHTAAKTPLWI